MDTQLLNNLIARRRSVFPPVFTDQPIEKEIIVQLLENANWAPNHRRTEPWRFQVFRGQALLRLADFMAKAYRDKATETSYSETKELKTRKNILRSDTVIVIILQHDPEEKVPEWEEIAAVAAAVQNLWLSTTAYGLGGYWSTPSTLPALTDWLDLPEGQRCMGIFYLGHYEMPQIPGQRGPVAEKIKWVED
ncbi:MAG: nitroreductase [Saprospiraceae bacterium]|nr:nitroreductase [Saprospiraceae bacterium]